MYDLEVAPATVQVSLTVSLTVMDRAARSRGTKYYSILRAMGMRFSPARPLRQLPEPARLERDLQDFQPGDRQGVFHRLREEGAKRNGAGLARSLGAEGVERGDRLLVADLDARHVEGRGEEEVHERGVEELAVLVVDELLEEGVADPLRHAAMDLTV